MMSRTSKFRKLNLYEVLFFQVLRERERGFLAIRAPLFLHIVEYIFYKIEQIRNYCISIV